MSLAELAVLLLILGSVAASCTLDDPCVNYTVLDQPWRSTNCSQTDCTNGQWMGDGNLREGWYRFHSSGGWTMPETVFPEDRCSGVIPGWLNGSHPNVTEGEVTRTVCFTWNEDTCYWSREIKLKNCSDYFVYQLKPTPCSRAVYCTAAGTARFDPCVTHTVLDQPWRSTDCSHTECTGGQWMGDGKLEVGWYRFNSSGGRMISETVFPEARCSGVIPGWLNGSHPSVEEGEVTRTVCFTWRDFTCYWRREIKVKNCCRYFVYQLKPAPCSSAVYCTAPETATTEQAKLTSTEVSTQEPSTAPREEPSLAPETATTEQAKLTSTEVSTQEPSTAPREEPSLEEEHTWIEVLVAASGGMTDEEVREATRQKLREMFGDPDPQLELVLCMSEIPEERGATRQRMKKSAVPSP
ncbi:uncharacterized protein [Hemitrygon akajei]|uniref:uncharacterized protein isoform X1 n=2 Tax=Hemitrygon akajei TaxID=2704970 RepID=UPI003BFA34C3